MKKNLLISVLMTVVTTILLGLVYPLVVTALAQLFSEEPGVVLQIPAADEPTFNDILTRHQLGEAAQILALGLIDFGTKDEPDQVGVLFDGARIAQVA